MPDTSKVNASLAKGGERTGGGDILSLAGLRVIGGVSLIHKDSASARRLTEDVNGSKLANSLSDDLTNGSKRQEGKKRGALHVFNTVVGVDGIGTRHSLRWDCEHIPAVNPGALHSTSSSAE